MEIKNIVNLLFEIGTLRKTARAHRQTLLTDDLSDNIASHSYRVSIIGMLLAFIEKADVGKVVMMCLTHDWPETRSGDHNWVHKRYVRIDTPAIILAQAALYDNEDLKKIIEEYEERKTKESLIAKDADTLDQLLLLKEYEHQGIKEATRWMEGRTIKRPYVWLERLKTDSAKELGKVIYDTSPSDWWLGLHTNENKPFK